MARKKLAEKNPPSNPQTQAPLDIPPPRLQVVVSDQAQGPGIRISSSLETFGIVGRELGSADREHFIILHLDGKNRLLARESIAAGSLSAAIVHPREVFKGAILNNSAAIVCAHNHPSGDPTPSREDIEITSRLLDAADILGIRILDHIIVGGRDYVSFADRGLLNKEAKTPVPVQIKAPASDSKPEVSREAAKRVIDAASNRLTFLLESDHLSRDLEYYEKVYKGGDEEFDGIDFVISNVHFSLEKLYYSLYPEEAPEGRAFLRECIGKAPSWDEPDLSGALAGPISALFFLYNSFTTMLKVRESASPQGIVGMKEVIRDIRASLDECAMDLQRAIEKE